MTDHTLMSDYLEALGVPHTDAYANRRFATMPFSSVFGLKKLLEEYGVDSEALELADKAGIREADTPFLAQMPGGFVIVTRVTPERVEYLTQGVAQQLPLSDFEQVWTGRLFIGYPRPEACEPGYGEHRLVEIADVVKRWALWACAVALFVYLVVTNGIYRHVSTVLVTLLDFGGLALTYMLVQKSLKIKNKHTDRVCAVLQEGGCDHVLEQKASTFFGIFSWSEVGFAYFSVSLLCLLIFPEWTRYLAACNVCCLPFTFWSIWCQKYRVKAWCTLCVSVQATLWMLFFCYLGGGWLQGVFPLRIEFFVLGVTYLTVLLALNRLMPLLSRKPNDPENV